MVFNATFSNFSVISRRSVSYVEETNLLNPRTKNRLFLGVYNVYKLVNNVFENTLKKKKEKKKKKQMQAYKSLYGDKDCSCNILRENKILS